MPSVPPRSARSARRAVAAAVALAGALAACGPIAPTPRRDWPAWLKTAPRADAYPPRLDRPTDAACRARIHRLETRFPGWRVRVNELCLAVRVERDAGGGDGPLTIDEVAEARRVLLEDPALFGLPFGAPPQEFITAKDGLSMVDWTQELGHSALSVTMVPRASSDHVTTPAGEFPEDVPRRIRIEGSFLPLAFPELPARRPIADLIAPLVGRPLYGVQAGSGSDPCETSTTEGGPLRERAHAGDFQVARGTLAVIHTDAHGRATSLELREVVHLIARGTFHTRGRTGAYSCATTEPLVVPPGDDPQTPPEIGYGVLLDARTGEDLTRSATPWIYPAFFGMDSADPVDVTRDGFFTATLPWPELTVPASEPPG